MNNSNQQIFDRFLREVNIRSGSVQVSATCILNAFTRWLETLDQPPGEVITKNVTWAFERLEEATGAKRRVDKRSGWSYYGLNQELRDFLLRAYEVRLRCRKRNE